MNFSFFLIISYLLVFPFALSKSKDDGEQVPTAGKQEINDNGGNDDSENRTTAGKQEGNDNGEKETTEANKWENDGGENGTRRDYEVKKVVLDECVGKKCGASCNFISPRDPGGIDGVCTGKGDCVHPIMNPCVKRGCKGKLCGERCYIAGDAMSTCKCVGGGMPSCGNQGPRFCVKNEDCNRNRDGWFCLRSRCQRRIRGRPFIVEGRSRTTSSQICGNNNLTNAEESWKMGEVPLVQSSNPYNQQIGYHWLKQAEAEHASVASFARHTLQLMSIGAPSRLLVASQEASIDEIKHAKMCYGFASAFISSDLGPGSLDVKGSLESMDLKDIIRSLIIGGCIGETLAAIEAHFSAYTAQDSAVKAAISEIASDETKHAQLAWDTIKWIVEKYPDSRTFADDIFRVELEQRKTPAINNSSLLSATLCQDSEKGASFRTYGLLISGVQDKVNEAGIRDIIEPVYRAGFKGVNMISKQIIELDVATLAHEARFRDIIEPANRAKFNDDDMIFKEIIELDTVTL